MEPRDTLGETFPIALGEFRDDEFVRVIAEFAHELWLERAIEHERVPVALVHVIAWNNGVMVCTKLHGPIGIALEIRLTYLHTIFHLETERCEHLALHFVNQYLWTEGRLFGHGWLGQEVLAELVRIHRCSLTRRSTNPSPSLWLLLLQGFDNAIHAVEHLLGDFGIADFEAEVFLQGHHNLKGID